MTIEIPPFNPDNYPRTYRCGKYAVEIYSVIAAFLILMYLISGPVSERTLVSIMFIIVALPVVIIWSKSKTLTLNRDSLEYSTLISRRLMNRNDIKGVLFYFNNGGGVAPSFIPDKIVFVPNQKHMRRLHVSFTFKADDFYDAWVSPLPCLGGSYRDRSIKEGYAVYNTRFHGWMAGGTKYIADIVSASNKKEMRKIDSK